MIELPDWPGPRSASGAIVDYGGFNAPPLGGDIQRIDRLGNRWKLAVSMPPIAAEPDGRVWRSRLVRGKTEGLRFPVPLLGFEAGAPGAVVVNGSGLLGRVLPVRGVTPRYPFREGQWLSIVQAGKRYLYQCDAETIASDAGLAALPVTPMLRAATLDGAVVEVGAPMIEGWVLGDEWRWDMSLELNLGLDFEIIEVS